MHDELAVLRERISKLSDQLARLRAAGATGPDAGSLLVQTVDLGNYPKEPVPPTAPVSPSYYAVRAIAPGGPEGEGETPAFGIPSPSPFYAANLGSQVPPAGTKVIVDPVGSRWVFIYDG